MPNRINRSRHSRFAVCTNHELFGDGVHVWGLERRGYDLDAGVPQDATELLGELGVAVEDQEAATREASVPIRDVARDLRHERVVGVRRDPDDLDHAARVVDHEQHVVRDQPARGPDLRSEEVGRGDGAGVRSQERAPARRPFWARRHTLVLQRLADRRPRDFVTDLAHLAADA